MFVRIALLCSLFTLCGSLVHAQEAPTPPAELAKYDRMLGHWQGSGSATMAPGAEATPWTSSSTVRKAMNGFFLQEDVTIDFGEGAPSQLVFRTFYGYDRENQRYMSCSMGNMGAPMASVLHWADADTLVNVETSVELGQFVVDRWVTKLGKDSLSFVGYRTIGAGEPFLHIEGSMKRAEKGFDSKAVAAAHAFTPVGQEMARLNRMAGTYRVQGTFQPIPEMPATEVAAKEVLEPLFDGAILEVRVTGDEHPDFGVYEAWGAFGWNPAKGRYISVYVNNMGEIAQTELTWVDGQLVSAFAGPMMGQPSAMRSVMTVDDKGVLTRSHAYMLMGTHPPVKSFDARYERL